jgi:hypothetical protein
MKNIKGQLIGILIAHSLNMLPAIVIKEAQKIATLLL